MPDEYFDKAIHSDPHQQDNACKGDLAAMVAAYPAEILNQPVAQPAPPETQPTPQPSPAPEVIVSPPAEIRHTED